MLTASLVIFHLLFTSFCFVPTSTRSNEKNQLNKKLTLLSDKLRTGHFDEGIDVARVLSNTPSPVKNAASFSELICLFFTGKKENMGEKFQEAGSLVDGLPQSQKKWIWNFISTSRISFFPSQITARYKRNKNINPDYMLDSYLGIATFLGNLNRIRSIQDSQKILFSLLDLLEEPSLIKSIKKPDLKRQIILGQISRNQEFLQILTKDAPMEVGLPAT